MRGVVEGWQEVAARMVLVLVIALALAPMVRGITADLSGSVGRAWPFALEHCRSLATPGCAFAEPGQYLPRLAAR